MEIYHGSREIVEFPEIRIGRYTVWNYVQDYLEGDISKEAFWELAKFRYPTHQISFHTLRAISCLKFERSYMAYE